jgi:hypothetical protein
LQFPCKSCATEKIPLATPVQLMLSYVIVTVKMAVATYVQISSHGSRYKYDILGLTSSNVIHTQMIISKTEKVNMVV